MAVMAQEQQPQQQMLCHIVTRVQPEALQKVSANSILENLPVLKETFPCLGRSLALPSNRIRQGMLV